MNTILMRFVGPMQSWGIESNFTVRDSGLEPSKSGVIGIVCAALGRPRDASVDDLTCLRMGVRVDREGMLRSDYQISQNVLDSSGSSHKSAVTSTRYYLADAAFLVGLEGNDIDLLEQIQHALQYPRWGLFLGRKAFPPSFPIWLNRWNLSRKVVGRSTFFLPSNRQL
ncbi:MAG: type I-E CRISPR-associated protein Cas5/CasD [Flexilinea sp.]